MKISPRSLVVLCAGTLVCLGATSAHAYLGGFETQDGYGNF